MAGSKARGRALLIKKGATTVAGIREAAYKISVEGIDVTNADSGIWREYLTGAEAQKSVSISGSGIAQEDDLRTAGFSTVSGGCLLTDITITDPSADAALDVISGNFLLTEYEIKGEYKGAVEFSFAMESSGTVSRA
jgi:TP901-1 family phage major tail protein